VDAILVETVNTWEEASNAVDGAMAGAPGLPILVSMQGALLTTTQPLTPQPQLAATIARSIIAKKRAGAPIIALSFNCAPPEVILQDLQVIQDAGLDAELRREGIKLGAYANVSNSLAPTGGVSFTAGWSSSNVKKRKLAVRSELSAELSGEDEGYPKWCQGFIEAGATCVGGCCSSTPEHIAMVTKRTRGTRARLR